MLPLLNLHPGMGQRVSVGVFLQPPLPILVLWVSGGAGAEALPWAGTSGHQDGGWGSRLRQQEVEDELRYKVEQEELEKALAMSMDF